MHAIAGSNTRSTGHWNATGRTLYEHKRQVLMRQLQKMQPLPRLAEIFRAMQGEYEAQYRVTTSEVSLYEPAETFAEFLEVNKLLIYEELIR